MPVSLKPVIEELESLFSTFNKAFFEGKLEKPVITVSPDSTKGAYGWCTGWKAWQNGTENGGFYEINLCAEYLNRPFERDHSAEEFDKKEAAADARKTWVQEIGPEQAHKLVDLYWGY